jgi:hypothetical protein
MEIGDLCRTGGGNSLESLGELGWRGLVSHSAIPVKSKLSQSIKKLTNRN